MNQDFKHDNVCKEKECDKCDHKNQNSINNNLNFKSALKDNSINEKLSNITKVSGNKIDKTNHLSKLFNQLFSKTDKGR